MTPSPIRLYLGQVMHHRSHPFRHRFRYRVFSLLIDIDRLPELNSRFRWLRYNRAGLLSFRDRDHGPRDGGALRPWVAAQAAAAGIEIADCRVELLCFPRVLGIVFNPIAVYFCTAPNGALRAVIYQVHNTFGEAHAYVAPGGQAGQDLLRHAGDKVFHVSPFIGMAARYAFALRPPGERLSLSIRETTADGPLLSASLAARAVPASDRTLLRAALALPLMTAKVIGGIHWEALHLFRKGARYHRRPPLPPSGATRLAPLTATTEHSG